MNSTWLWLLLVLLRPTLVVSQLDSCTDAGDAHLLPDFPIHLDLQFPWCDVHSSAKASETVRVTLASCLYAWRGRDPWVLDKTAEGNCTTTFKFDLGVERGRGRRTIQCLMGGVVSGVKYCEHWHPPGSSEWPPRPMGMRLTSPQGLPENCYMDQNSAILCKTSSYLFFVCVIVTTCVGGLAAILMILHTLRQRRLLQVLRRQLHAARTVELQREADRQVERAKALRIYTGIIVVSPNDLHQVAIQLDDVGQRIAEPCSHGGAAISSDPSAATQQDTESEIRRPLPEDTGSENRRPLPGDTGSENGRPLPGDTERGNRRLPPEAGVAVLDGGSTRSPSAANPRDAESDTRRPQSEEEGLHLEAGSSSPSTCCDHRCSSSSRLQGSVQGPCLIAGSAPTMPCYAGGQAGGLRPWVKGSCHVTGPFAAEGWAVGRQTSKQPELQEPDKEAATVLTGARAAKRESRQPNPRSCDIELGSASVAAGTSAADLQETGEPGEVRIVAHGLA